MSVIETINRLMDDLGVQELTFTRGQIGPNLMSAIVCKQVIPGTNPDLPPTAVTHQKVFTNFVECLNAVTAAAEHCFELAPKKSEQPTNISPLGS